MTERDSFLERLDDVLYEVWKLKKTRNGAT